MKIKISVPKPRNLLAVAVKQRRAGAHETDAAGRKLRRAEKHRLHQLLSGTKVRDSFDT